MKDFLFHFYLYGFIAATIVAVTRDGGFFFTAFMAICSWGSIAGLLVLKALT